MIPPIANRFVAGETHPEVLDRARRLNDHNVGAVVNRLGSHHDEWAQVASDAEAYRTLVEDIAGASLDASVTVKPSQVGLDLGEAVFRTFLSDLVETAHSHGVTVWLDMEEPTTTDATLDAFETLAKAHGGGIGVCVQADLKRTRADLERLVDVPGRIRLVKGGAYDVSETIAYQEKSRVNAAYRDLLKYAFEHADGGIAVGTHDPDMIEHAIALHETFGTEFEFQMLMGVREEAQYELARSYDVSQYVPYGERWKRWALNRAKNNVRFVAEALVRS